jgi:hypothetical protein
MSECDDITEVESSAPDTLSEYVTHALDVYVSVGSNVARDKSYGIFYNGVRLRMRSGKSTFKTVRAAKLSLRRCLPTAATKLARTNAHSYPELAHLVDPKLSWIARVDLFCEEVLRQVEIKELGLDALT